MRKISLIICLGAILFWTFVRSSGAAESHGAAGRGHGQVKNELKAYFQELTEQGSFSGAVLVARDGKILLKKGYGMADYEQNIRNKPDTVFAISSLTKAFTAVSIMMLEERGLLSLDDTVADHIPDFPNGDLITIRNLLNHASGLFEYLDNPDLWVNSDRYHTPEELLEYFMYEPLNFQPGTQFEYSNSNYITAGRIVENVSGLSFRDFVRINILEPLRMDRTGYDPYETDFPEMAVGYDDILSDPPAAAMYFHPSISYSSGGMCSTVQDLYKWDQALYTEALVSLETLEKIFTPGLGDYGFGWYIDLMEVNGLQQKHIWHWAASLGFHGFFSRLTDDKVTIIILSNISALTWTPDELRPVAERAASIILEHYQ